MLDNNEIKEELSSIKEELKGLREVLLEYKLLEQKIDSSNAKHDEGRKIIHKRIDLIVKVAFWVGSTVFTGMAGVIWVLVERVLK